MRLTILGIDDDEGLLSETVKFTPAGQTIRHRSARLTLELEVADSDVDVA